MALTLLLAVTGYPVGTVPTAVVVGRSVGHDPTREGSRDPGASNVYRTAGRRAGGLTALIVIRHWSNLDRLWHGRERRLQAGRP